MPAVPWRHLFCQLSSALMHGKQGRAPTVSYLLTTALFALYELLSTPPCSCLSIRTEGLQHAEQMCVDDCGGSPYQKKIGAETLTWGLLGPVIA